MQNETDTPKESPNSITSRDKKIATAAFATGVVTTLIVAPHVSTAVEAAQRILTPEPAATGEAAPLSIAQQDFDIMIENARKNNDPNIQFGTDILVTGPETRLYDEALAQVPPNLLEENRENIQGILLQSAKTANTDQPDAPYITHPGQVYQVIMTDLNSDGYGEFVVALKEDGLDDGTIPSPITR